MNKIPAHKKTIPLFPRCTVFGCDGVGGGGALVSIESLPYDAPFLPLSTPDSYDAGEIVNAGYDHDPCHTFRRTNEGETCTEGDFVRTNNTDEMVRRRRRQIFLGFFLKVVCEKMNEEICVLL